MDDLRRRSIRAIRESEYAAEYGLTPKQGSAISQLKLMLEEHPGGVSLKSLAARMQMTVPACSLLVEALVCKNFMQRVPNPEDRRAVLISLSEAGLRIFENVYAQFHAEIDRRARELSASELNTLERIVKKISTD